MPLLPIVNQHKKNSYCEFTALNGGVNNFLSPRVDATVIYIMSTYKLNLLSLFYVGHNSKSRSGEYASR